MLSIYQKIICFCAITSSSVLASTYSLPLHAQTSTVDGSSILEGVETGEDLDWSFTSEDEPISVKDDIKELEDYSLSGSDSETDLELIEEERKWGNRGDVEDYSVEVEVYDY